MHMWSSMAQHRCNSAHLSACAMMGVQGTFHRAGRPLHKSQCCHLSVYIAGFIQPYKTLNMTVVHEIMHLHLKLLIPLLSRRDYPEIHNTHNELKQKQILGSYTNQVPLIILINRQQPKQLQMHKFGTGHTAGA